jgi:hypothetical protein
MSERSCGTCGLCCKILPIPHFQKPPGPWCTHCRPGKGCSIYADRPQDCREFYCGWLKIPEMGEELRPDRCHFIVRMDTEPKTARFDVDPAYPGTIGSKALVNLRQGLNAQGFTIIVNLGTSGTVHLPDGTTQPLIVAESPEAAQAEIARRGLAAGTYYVQYP